MHPKVSAAATTDNPIVALFGEGGQEILQFLHTFGVNRNTLLLIEIHTVSPFLLFALPTGRTISGKNIFESAFSKTGGQLSH